MSAALQAHNSDIQSLDNKSLFLSLVSPHEVWAWSFSTLCIYSKLSEIISKTDLQQRKPNHPY